ncbi:MAG TPA: translation initiation factor IF-2 N-terminal domain-containing protein, partial [Pyrinomonadaceae bacterium]|nr:translation initiation factor IF-2 N-terminal domain-containing protein [Pyrinomonadaceae bacterium]
MGKKIRIYDLARELKQDAKRVMEDLRREGADVSVPSNSVSAELAEKVRIKYFPKTEVAPKRGIKVIKAAKKSEAEEAIADEPVEEVVETETPVEVPEVVIEEPTLEPEDEATAAPAVKTKVLKKKAKAVEE